ncbi:hypothetical protein [Novipirellula aureliae]|nr:hypothetical protein [Novipirellula aureliae]
MKTESATNDNRCLHLGKVGWRECLLNDRRVGPTEHVSVAAEQAGMLHGIMIDLDLNIFDPGAFNAKAPQSPTEFFDDHVARWLDRSTLLRKAEARCSGNGIHVLLWLDPPIPLISASDRKLWDACIRIVQTSLPSDPDAPGLTSLTRPIGSINEKSNLEVKLLREGQPVTQDEIITFRNEMISAPFKTVHRILAGDEHQSPCPICRKDGTTLTAMDRTGMCYGSCGKVKPERLLDVFLRPRRSEGRTK